MMQCQNCGAEVNSSQKFCPQCGTPLDLADDYEPAYRREPRQNARTRPVRPAPQKLALPKEISTRLVASILEIVIVLCWFIGKKSDSGLGLIWPYEGSKTIAGLAGVPITIVVLILCLASAFVCIRPVLSGAKSKLVLNHIFNFVVFVLYFIASSRHCFETKTGDPLLQYNADYSLFAIFIPIACVILMVVFFMIAAKERKQSSYAYGAPAGGAEVRRPGASNRSHSA